jgi:Flp pilus assembly protein TadB
MSGEKPPQNGSAGITSVLTTLASSGNTWVQLATVGMIAFSGIGNWVATWNSADRNKQEIEVSRRVAWEGEQRIREDVRKQINDMHEWMDKAKEEFHRGNQDSASNRQILLKLTEQLNDMERQLSKQ